MKTTKTTSPALMKIPVRLLAILLFFCLSQTSSYAGLVGQWVADDWAGGTANWVDRVAGKIATVASAANSPTKTPGAIVGTATGSGIVFDGVNDYLLVAPTANPIQGKNSVTIVAFFNTTQGASGSDGAFWRYPGPVNGESPSSPNDWGLTYNAAGNAQGFFNGPITPSPAVSLIGGQPHTMILTWQDPTAFPGQGVARLYVDGILVGSVGPTDGGNGVNNANGFVIGSDREGILLGGPRFFSGAIGELRFYDSIEDPATLHAEIFGGAAVTTAATALGVGTATLNGIAYPDALSAVAHFRFGTDPTLTVGTDTPPQAIGSGFISVPVNQGLVGFDPDTRYYFQLIVGNAKGTFAGRVRSLFLGAEISVEQPAGTSLVDGTATVSFGGVPVGSTSPKTFTIKNTGDFPMTGLSITKDGANPGDFSVSALGSTTVAPGASTTFAVSFTPPAAGGRNAAIHIASNVSGSKNPFDIALTGTGVPSQIWTGPRITFTHTDYSSTSDQLTPRVWLTRDYYGGIQNVAPNPGGIEWAVGTTANLGALTFQSYAIGTGVKPPIGPNLVLHLISENIYLDIRILSWTDGGGGGFSYSRSTPLVVNRPPVANAGSNFSVNEGAVTLDGSLSTDPDQDPLTYTWTQTGGTPVTITPNGTHASSSSFNYVINAPHSNPGETLTFTLRVSDGIASNTSAPVSVFVRNVNRAPGAATTPVAPVFDNVGLVTLNGSGSDPDGDAVNLRWQQVGGTNVTLNDATTATPSFTAPPVTEAQGSVTLTFQLIANDSNGSGDTAALDSAPVTVDVLVKHANRAPIADAGHAVDVPEQTPVTLDGTGSYDPDMDPFTYAWVQTAGSYVALNFTNPAKPTFTAPNVGPAGETLTFQLIVTDSAPAGSGGDLHSAPSSVAINVKYLNQPPLADAGAAQAADEGGVATLHGSGSDPDGNAFTYQWAQTGGPAVALSDATAAQPTFTGPLVDRFGATLTFALQTKDEFNAQSNVATTSVVINNFNHAPHADAGALQSVPEGTPVGLTGAGFDPDTEELPLLTYAWVQTFGPAVVLTGANTATPSFTAPLVTAGGDPNAKVKLKFQLTVTDPNNASSSAETCVSVTNVEHAPIANAGGIYIVNEAALATLDGSLSSDPDGDTLTYAWAQTAGTPVMLSSANSAHPSFTAPFVNAAGATLKFALTVNDGFGGVSSDTATVSVKNINDPPTLVNPRASTTCLWPPNHQMVPISILGVVDPNNNVTITITSVTQDEPTAGLGNGDVGPDAIIQGSTVMLRAERLGDDGNGRVYHIHFTASDIEGSVSGVVTVCVPHDKKHDDHDGPDKDDDRHLKCRKALCVDGGELYDSTKLSYPVKKKDDDKDDKKKDDDKKK